MPHFVVSRVTRESPILHPPQIFAVGLNYADHVAEPGMETPKFPMIFNTQYTSARGPFASIHRSAYSTALDYEGELAVVIGKSCHHVPRDRAHEVVAGWTVCNDVWVRDRQLTRTARGWQIEHVTSPGETESGTAGTQPGER